MKNFAYLAFCTMILTACHTAPAPTVTPSVSTNEKTTKPTEKPIRKTTENRLCTMQYEPVCGKVEANGVISYKTYGNACSASISPDNVLSYTDGSCEGSPILIKK